MPTVDLRIVNDDGGEFVFSRAFTYAYPPPVITAIDPASGPSSGGTTVTLIGSGFRPGAIVEFGGKPASVVSVTPTSIVCVTPAA